MVVRWLPARLATGPLVALAPARVRGRAWLSLLHSWHLLSR